MHFARTVLGISYVFPLIEPFTHEFGPFTRKLRPFTRESGLFTREFVLHL
jgi:hypothetical protein